MIESIKGWITNIVTIMILLSFLEILMPESKIKKYLNLILGFIVMLIILSPIIDMLNSKSNLEKDVFMISSELNKKEYSFINFNIEDKQEDQLRTLYRARIEKDIAYRVESKYDVEVTNIDIEIEDSIKGKMGEIKKLELSVNNKKEKKMEDAVAIVEIDISKAEESNNNDKNKDIDIGLRKKIKEDISDIYNLNKADVIINN